MNKIKSFFSKMLLFLPFLVDCKTQEPITSHPSSLSVEAKWRLDCNQGQPTSCMALANSYQQSQDSSKQSLAMPYYKRACRLGHQTACSLATKVESTPTLSSINAGYTIPFPKEAKLESGICPDKLQSDCQTLFTQIRTDLLEHGSALYSSDRKISLQELKSTCSQSSNQCFELIRNIFLPYHSIPLNIWISWSNLSLLSCSQGEEKACQFIVTLFTNLSSDDYHEAALALLKAVTSDVDKTPAPLEQVGSKILELSCLTDTISCGGYALWQWKGLKTPSPNVSAIRVAAQKACVHGGKVGCQVLKELPKTK